jgi:hypothetical protein
MRSPAPVLVVLALAGCANALQRAALDNTAAMMWRAQAAMEQESDLTIARAAVSPGLKQAEGLYVTNPDSLVLQRLLARGYCGYAAFVQDDSELAVIEQRFDDADRLADRAASLYLRCLNYALLPLGDGWSPTLLFAGGTELESRLARVPRRHARELLWAGVGLGGAINMKMGDLRVVAQLGKVELLLRRAIELDPGHESGMAMAVLGSLQCGRSQALGGELAAGRDNIEAALRASGGKMLMAKVLLARHCAVNAPDRALFHETLIDVLRTAPNVWPEQRLANELARHKARVYLQHEKELF